MGAARWCCAVGWTAAWLLCFAPLAFGIPIWFIYAGLAQEQLSVAFDFVQQALGSGQAGAPAPADLASTRDAVLGAAASLREGGLIALLAASALALVAAAAHVSQAARSG
ncbi:hypothetical protein MNEG_15516 [Monoraphidium neglectum]|jgi:hypothetical protein|uniref:Uncharacterized protein n=1 Tax=Monoraphidium neglectum TaxID=145388 RepID=A0A0D2IWT5_9CHLO|nr:hypothetical protein MNEG_15516 [Monoraphidium neglectum]KIY92447.1 hypothetical protein MNEG_15516 [Monoraphidium neglectum]|eukprot:XP_013891467.1 hypothetical protein MNEG_15516 [Monoraphidium neglectum]